MPWSSDGEAYIDSGGSFFTAVCPGCNPDSFDYRTMDARPCDNHGGFQRNPGSEDDLVPAGQMPGTASDAGDETNRAICNLLHRNIEPTGPIAEPPPPPPIIVEG